MLSCKLDLARDAIVVLFLEHNMIICLDIMKIG